MRVPEGVKKGKAKITLSFQDWKQGKVVPTVSAVPVEELEEGYEPKVEGRKKEER